MMHSEWLGKAGGSSAGLELQPGGPTLHQPFRISRARQIRRSELGSTLGVTFLFLRISSCTAAEPITRQLYHHELLNRQESLVVQPSALHVSSRHKLLSYTFYLLHHRPRSFRPHPRSSIAPPNFATSSSCTSTTPAFRVVSAASSVTTPHLSIHQNPLSSVLFSRRPLDCKATVSGRQRMNIARSSPSYASKTDRSESIIC